MLWTALALLPPSILQGNTTIPGSNLPLPEVSPSLIQDCKALRLKLALSVNPQPYYYDIGYTTINMQNMTKSQFEEVNKLMTTAASDTSYYNYTAQKIYDIEIAESYKWRNLSKDFTNSLAENEQAWNPYTGVPLEIKIGNLTDLHNQLYIYWRQIYMIALPLLWHEACFSQLQIH